MIRGAIVTGGVIVMAAALWTGADHGFFTAMTGLLPPHYGYSAYVVSALLFLGPRYVREPAGLTLLLSGNRASWLGGIAGWAWRGGRRRAALAAILCVLAGVGGLAWKRPAQRRGNDVERVHIWRAALRLAAHHPAGIGRGNFCMGIDGREVAYAHSDALQFLVVYGWAAAALALWAWVGGFWLLPAGPAKDAVVALTAQSVIDNRLHHPVCAALYVAVWILAATARVDGPGDRGAIGLVADPQAAPQ